MSTLSRPPRDISASEFFESWLPEQYKQLKTEQSGDATVPNVAISVTLEGDGGGEWTLSLSDGELAVRRTASAGALLSITQTVEDWRSVVAGDGGGDSEAELPSGFNVASVLTDSGTLDLIKDVKGSIRFEIPQFRGRTFGVSVMFNGAAEPAAGVSVDAVTIAAIRAGTLAAPQAFFSGKIQLTGDTTLAMQLGMAMAARGR